MIFQSLIGLYDRLVDVMPPYGFSTEDIGFVITLDKDGNLVGPPEDLRVKLKANTYDYRASTVPYTNQVNVRANAAAKTPNFMVDKADYVFGMSGKSKKDVHHNSFKELIGSVCFDSSDEGVWAVRAFLNNWRQEKAVDLRDWKEISGMYGKWVAFRLKGDRGFVHERPAVAKMWSDFVSREEFTKGVSLMDGVERPLQTQYAQFKFGSGASLVSFNEVAYESYGKKKGNNAPISVEAEFKSSSALKYLLRSKTQRIRIGDASTLFWAERATDVEPIFGQILNPSISDDASTVKIKAFLQQIQKGLLPDNLEKDKNLRFFILGLSVNKARLALRFWHVSTVSELMGYLRDHFRNLAMEHSDKDIAFPGVWHLLKETARETKDISPVIGGALTRSILTGAQYPLNLYQGVLGRIRADNKINYLRASIIKATLQRNYKREVPVSLDPERRDAAYLLGRLFAVLEKAQMDALGKVNSTIKDRFFSAASATPASVFPRLLRLSQHHIEKAEYGYVSDRRISEVMEHVDGFPPHMNLQDQGLFAIAYYQQKNALYRKNESTIEESNNE